MFLSPEIRCWCPHLILHECSCTKFNPTIWSLIIFDTTQADFYCALLWSNWKIILLSFNKCSLTLQELFLLFQQKQILVTNGRPMKITRTPTTHPKSINILLYFHIPHTRWEIHGKTINYNVNAITKCWLFIYWIESSKLILNNQLCAKFKLHNKVKQTNWKLHFTSTRF